MIWYVEENKTEGSYGNTIPRNFVVWYVEENFRIDELQCCSDVEVLVCKAVKMFKCWRPKKKSAWTDPDQVNFEKNLQCPNVQIEKLVWTGLGKVSDVATSSVTRWALGITRWALRVGRWALRVGRCALGITCWALRVGRYALGVTCFLPKCRKKKSVWTDLDKISFKRSNVEIEKSAWTGLGKVKKGLFSGKCL